MRALLGTAPTIGLDEMEGSALLNRVDCKFALPAARLPDVLRAVLPAYRVLSVGDHRLFTYYTRYFDTPDFRFYRDHHNGVANRIKVRCREYQETGLRFFEVKRKVHGIRTEKYRRPIEEIFSELGAAEYAEVHARYRRYPFTTLRPVLDNHFHRATLVGAAERCTLDFDLDFQSLASDGASADVAGLAIIEVKQARASIRSAMARVLKAEGIHPCSISKYAYGTVLTAVGVKKNAFKSTVRHVERMLAT